MDVKIDRYDRSILSAIQRNNQCTVAELGQSVGLSKSATQRRLASMREKGLVEADIAILNPDRVGSYLTFLMIITLTNADTKTMDRLNSAVNRMDEIQQCYHVTGSIDYFAIASVSNREHFARLTKELFYDNPDIKRFESSLVVDRVKVGLSLPL